MSSYLLRRAPAAARAFSTSSPRTLARISIIGNLGEAPELQTTSNGQEIVKYVVASNSGPASNRHTSWFHVTKFLDAERKGKDFFLGLQKGCVSWLESELLSVFSPLFLALESKGKSGVF